MRRTPGSNPTPQTSESSNPDHIHSTPIPQPQALNAKPNTLNSNPLSQSPEPTALNPNPPTANTRRPSYTWHQWWPNPLSPGPKPLALNPKSQPPNRNHQAPIVRLAPMVAHGISEIGPHKDYKGVFRSQHSGQHRSA